MNNTQPTISLAEMKGIIEVLGAAADLFIEEATAIAETDPMEAIYTAGIAKGLNAASNTLYSTFFANPKDFA